MGVRPPRIAEHDWPPDRRPHPPCADVRPACPAAGKGLVNTPYFLNRSRLPVSDSVPCMRSRRLTVSRLRSRHAAPEKQVRQQGVGTSRRTQHVPAHRIRTEASGTSAYTCATHRRWLSTPRAALTRKFSSVRAGRHTENRSRASGSLVMAAQVPRIRRRYLRSKLLLPKSATAAWHAALLRATHGQRQRARGCRSSIAHVPVSGLAHYRLQHLGSVPGTARRGGGGAVCRLLTALRRR